MLWGGGAPKGWVQNLLMQVFTLDSSKIEVFKTCLFDVVTNQYDHPSYLKHILGRVTCFSPYVGVELGGGTPKGLVYSLPKEFFTLATSKIEVFKTCFFDIVTTQYDHPSHPKHIWGRICMSFTLFGYQLHGGGGGGLPSDWHTA